MKGIDISEHNKYIDFQEVKNSGIDFVIIRMGWIGNKQNHTLDKYFEDYYQNAKKAGLKIGFYVYSYCKSLKAIQDGVIWTLAKIQGKQCDMPIFLDLEDESISNINKEDLTIQAKYFCETIELNSFKAGIYANKYWFTNKLNINQLISFKIWLAEWNNKNNHSANFKVDLWQYTSNGNVLGINRSCRYE